MDKIKTPVTYTIYDPDRFKFAVYKDANGVLSPEQIAAALNTAADQSRVIEELTAELAALRREVEAGKRYKNLACKTDRFEGVAADGTAWSITWRDDRWYWINREVVSVMDDPIEALELLAALEGESR